MGNSSRFWFKWLGRTALALAIAVIAHFEGMRHQAYLDTGGVPTICAGHTQGVKIGQTATEAQCEAYLQGEVKASLAVVDRYTIHPQPVTRRAALASFVYNEGAGNFLGSTLLKKLNAGDVVGACHELTHACHVDKATGRQICDGWIYDNGVKIPGLVKRREEEEALCLYEEPN